MFRCHSDIGQAQVKFQSKVNDEIDAGLDFQFNEIEFELKGNLRDVLIDTRKIMKKMSAELDSMKSKVEELTLDNKQLKQQNELLSQKVSKLEAERTKLDTGTQQNFEKDAKQLEKEDSATGVINIHSHK